MCAMPRSGPISAAASTISLVGRVIGEVADDGAVPLAREAGDDVAHLLGDVHGEHAGAGGRDELDRGTADAAGGARGDDHLSREPGVDRWRARPDHPVETFLSRSDQPEHGTARPPPIACS